MIKVPTGTIWLVLAVLVLSGGYMVWLAGPWSWPAVDFLDGGQVTDPPQEPGDTGAIVDDTDPPDWKFSDREAFFIEFRLERERIRSRELDILQQLINNPNVTAESRREAEQSILRLQALMETELMVENTVKAQGYKNAIMIMKQEYVTIVVDASELSRGEVNLLARLVADATGIPVDRVIITSQAPK